VLAHGFASPRHRGFAIVGNQCCTDSAATLAHNEYAGKTDFAAWAGPADLEGPTVTIMWEIPALPHRGIVQMHPGNCFRGVKIL
jgi:hypothetical protein